MSFFLFFKALVRVSQIHNVVNVKLTPNFNMPVETNVTDDFNEFLVVKEVLTVGQHIQLCALR